MGRRSDAAARAGSRRSQGGFVHSLSARPAATERGGPWAALSCWRGSEAPPRRPRRAASPSWSLPLSPPAGHRVAEEATGWPSHGVVAQRSMQARAAARNPQARERLREPARTTGPRAFELRAQPARACVLGPLLQERGIATQRRRRCGRRQRCPRGVPDRAKGFASQGCRRSSGQGIHQGLRPCASPRAGWVVRKAGSASC